MDFRDFMIDEHDNDTIVISQRDCTDPDYVNSIYLDKKQIKFLVESLIGEDILDIGYLATVDFEELSEPLKVLVNSPSELCNLHKDINMNGFGIECEVKNSERILYKMED